MSKKPKLRKQCNKQLKPAHRVDKPQQSDVAQTSRLRAILHWVLYLGVPGLLLGVLGLFVAALPRVGFGSHDPLDVSRPLAAVDFPVTNQGNFAIHSAFYACHIHELTMSDGSEIHDFKTTGEVSPGGSLAPGGSFSVQCGIGFHVTGVVTGGDIDIGLKYRPGLLPWTAFSCGKFVLDTSLVNHPRWMQSPGVNCQHLRFVGDKISDKE